MEESKDEIIWTEMNSDKFSKQYYHSNYKLFSWSDKLEKDKKTVINGYSMADGLRSVRIYGIDNKIKKSFLHRLVYFTQHNDETECFKCKRKEYFDIFNSKDYIVMKNDDKNDCNPDNLIKLCNFCGRKKNSKEEVKEIKDEEIKDEEEDIKRRINKKFIYVVYKKDDDDYIELFSNISEISEKFFIPKSIIKKIVKVYHDSNEIIWHENYRITYNYKNCEEIEDEIFKEIPNIKGILASNKGRIKFENNDTQKYNIITYGDTTSDNRNRVYINNRSYYVYVLVLRAFDYEGLLKKAEEIKNSPKYPECKDMSIEEIIDSHHTRYCIQVDHIDRNSSNNCLENLRWVTQQENNINTERVNTIQQFSKDKKTLITEFNSISEAAEELCTSAGNITAVCNGLRPSAANFFWRVKPEENADFIEEEKKEEVKNVQQYSLDGKLIAEFTTQTEAMEKTKIQGISAACLGKRKTAGGFVWKLKDTSTVRKTNIIQQYSKDGKTLIKEFPSQSEAQKETGVKAQNISECCYGRQKTAKGYVWKFKEDN
jgi:hypothetical protein